MFIVIWLLCGLIGYLVGNNKGRGGEGLALGILLGLIGVVIVLCLKPKNAVPTAMRPTQIAGWYPDPYVRHEYRYWDGRGWSNNVSDRGVHTVDLYGAVPPPPVAPASEAR